MTGARQGTDAKEKGDGGNKPGGGQDTYDGIVLALPAGAAGRLIQPIAPEVARMLSRIPYASVSVVTLHVEHPAANDLPDGTGYVVPADSGQMVTACTFLSKKWPHLATGRGSLLRVSLGRYRDSRHLSLDKQGLVETVTTELEQMLHRHIDTRASLVTRWMDAFPQYRVGHLAMVEQIRRTLPEIGPVSLAGAAYGGVGIPACIKSGHDAMTSILEQLRNATW
jgi:oxygen-dependent protoporphyrinogen oxidase